MTETEIKQIEIVRESLENLTEDFKNTLPVYMPVGKFIECIISYLKFNPSLLSKNRQSLFNAFDDAAEMGLYIDGREAALNPYKESVKLAPMIGGYVKQLSLAGVSITAEIVYKNDIFKYWTDETGQRLNHEPDVFKSDEARGEAIGCYCIAKTTNGHTTIDIMSKEDILKRKEKSQQKDSLMWTTFWKEGWKKTVIRHAYKLLPKNESMDKLVKSEDEDVDLTTTPTSQQIEPAKKSSDTPRLDNLIENTGAEKTKTTAPAVTASKPAETKPLPVSEVIEGAIEGMSITPVDVEGKQKNRFKVKIKDLVFGTLDEKLYREQIEPCANEKLLIRLSWHMNKETMLRDIDMIERVTADEHFNKETQPSKKDIPL